MTVTAVSDGVLSTSHDVVLGRDAGELAARTGAPFGSAVSIDVNCFLLRTPDRTLLIDAGGGGWTYPSLGRLIGNLRALGVEPEHIDTILLTHCHPDHSNGLIDEGGRAVFPLATVFLHEKEAAFWLDTEVSESASEKMKRNAKAIRASLLPYLGRMRRIESGEVLAGISAVLRAGHTPGHTTWLLRSGGERLLVWGDIVHFADIQIADPDAGLTFDLDPAAACASRRQVFEWLAQESVVGAGAHIAFPGFGYVSHLAEGYQFRPA